MHAGGKVRRAVLLRWRIGLHLFLHLDGVLLVCEFAMLLPGEGAVAVGDGIAVVSQGNLHRAAMWRLVHAAEHGRTEVSERPS